MSLLKERIKLADKMRRQPETKFQAVDMSMRWHPKWMTRSFANNRYIVMIQDNANTTHGNATLAMIQAVDDQPIKNHWSELQRIKREIFGDVTAIEYYPTESELIDDHNIYWLWIFPDGIIPKKI